MGYKKISKALKKKILKEVEETKEVTSVAKKYGVDPSSIFKWKKYGIEPKPPEPKPQRNPASILECERDYDFDNLEQQLFKKQLE